MGVAWLIAMRAKPVYEARAAIEIEAPGSETGETGYTPAESYLQTQLQLLESDSLISKAAVDAALTGDIEFNRPSGNTALIRNARKHLTVTRAGSSRLIRIAFTATVPNEAADFANALVDAYLAEREERTAHMASALTTQLKGLQTELEESETKVVEFAKTYGEPAADPVRRVRYDALVREVDSRRQLYESMLRRAKEYIAVAAIPQSSVRIVDRAEAPAQPVSSNLWLNVLPGLPIGLLCGWLFAALANRMRRPEPTALLPAHTHSWNRVVEAGGGSPGTPFTEQVNSQEMNSHEDASTQILAVTSVCTGATSPDTVLGFAETLVTPDRKVLVVDCEIGGPMTQAAGLADDAGFSDFLSEDPAARGVLPVWKSTHDGVYLMPGGTKPYRIPGLLAKPAAAREALTALLAQYDRIVINAPSILTSGEMRDLTPLVDGVVLVTPVEPSASLTYAAARQVEEYGGKILGLVEDSRQLAAA
jgi:Mrp family chromosome partitioning ATPase